MHEMHTTHRNEVPYFRERITRGRKPLQWIAVCHGFPCPIVSPAESLPATGSEAPYARTSGTVGWCFLGVSHIIYSVWLATENMVKKNLAFWRKNNEVFHARARECVTKYRKKIFLWNVLYWYQVFVAIGGESLPGPRTCTKLGCLTKWYLPACL